MKYKRKSIILKIMDDCCNADMDTIIASYRELLEEGLSKLDDETLLCEAIGRSIIEEEDEIEE